MARRRNPEHRAFCQRLQRAFGAQLHNARRNGDAGRQKQDVLAAALGITRTSVSNMERGNHRVFLDQVYLAAKALGIDARDLLPAMSEVFPERQVQQAPDVKLKQDSTRLLGEIAANLHRRIEQGKPIVARAVQGKQRSRRP